MELLYSETGHLASDFEGSELSGSERGGEGVDNSSEAHSDAEEQEGAVGRGEEGEAGRG